MGRLFCQLGRAHSLRQIESGLKSCEGKLAHLGIEAPARSSPSYANGHRPWELFEKVAAKAQGKHKVFRFKNKLVSIHSTTIDLCLSMYDWAKFRRTKGAVKPALGARPQWLSALFRHHPRWQSAPIKNREAKITSCREVPSQRRKRCPIAPLHAHLGGGF